MNNRTFTLTVAAKPDAVFDYFSNPEKLPEWATDFCKSIRRDGDHWKVDTPGGELFFAVTADRETGVVDMHAGPTPDRMNPLRGRVFGPEAGPATATFTMYQGAACSDEQFEAQSVSMRKELSALTDAFGGGRVEVAGMPAGGYGGFAVADPMRSLVFYRDRLGFAPVFESEGYTHLVHPERGVSLAFLKAGECPDMAELKTPTNAQGLWIGLDVEDVDAESERLWNAGVEIAQGPTDQPWGERTCVIRDPDGILIYLAHKIAAADAGEEANATTKKAAVAA